MRPNFEQIEQDFTNQPEWAEEQLPILQVVVYVAAGGGNLGRQYAEHPVGALEIGSGRGQQYGPTSLENIVRTLIACAKGIGIDPENLPLMPDVHDCGVW